ncbi:hypothetical protein KBY97_08260 [Synechococcus sp. ATX 2A4]|uniref:hypothetical protein n=1 Tax=Synechococcus sp. ATX 2A4 TaxID=2823727 RepID=UPI0020CBC80E|nr:hypothetical protein [Synechococcus sp. ATX 2A4]MCP9885117.1 hypothetical protein [Synechococcus sp. ATX 2A4]
MPLSFGASLVLLLSGLSVQTAVLQSRARLEAGLRRDRAEDALASAAQQVASKLSGPFACLLTLPSQHWHGRECAQGHAAAGLMAGTVAELPYQLVEWRPATGSEPAQLVLQLAAERGAARIQRRFAVSVGDKAGSAPIQSVRGLGL